MQDTLPSALNITRSITGKSWQWRGGNGDVRSSADFRPDDLVTQLLLSRGASRDELEQHRNPTIRGFMPDPSVFRDMDSAAERLAQAILAQEKVTIYGDYDVDGATSAAVLIRLLRDLGLEAGAYIPDRLMEGYGPSGAALVKLAEQGSTLIVTVDCGAMAYDALSQAKAAGVDVVVVDHHKCAVELPEAYALVNPNRLDESDEGAVHGHLAAVGMAFLLGAALIRTLRGHGFFKSREEPKLLELLDIVALGTVADVAKLQGLNRAFVAQGLKVMRQGRNIGLNALIEASRLTRKPVSSDLGFAIGPRINAGGRVGKSDLGVRLLTTQDADEARDIAAQLNQLNEERRAIEAHVQAEAEEMISAQLGRAVMVLAGKGWHPGVIGIVAGRIKEKTGKPSVVIAVDDEGVGKGSGRSIYGVDLGAAIIAAKDEGHLVAGGGHAMAAGLTIDEDKLESFAEYLDERLSRDVGESSAHQTLLLDAVIAPGGVTPDLVTAMEDAGPYGMGWPGPRIATGPVRIVKCDVVGTDHLRTIVAGDDGRSIKTIAFRQADSELGQTLLNAPRDRKLWIAGRAKIDDWGSRPAAELHLEDAAWID